MLADIEDQGDVLLLASEHEQAKDYYRGCLERDADSS